MNDWAGSAGAQCVARKHFHGCHQAAWLVRVSLVRAKHVQGPSDVNIPGVAPAGEQALQATEAPLKQVTSVCCTQL
jgi:hypothetical protein